MFHEINSSNWEKVETGVTMVQHSLCTETLYKYLSESDSESANMAHIHTSQRFKIISKGNVVNLRPSHIINYLGVLENIILYSQQIYQPSKMGSRGIF